jgi:hypothetical protein
MKIINIRYQETAVEDTAGWRRFSVCSSDWYSVKIRDSAVSTCSSALCV